MDDMRGKDDLRGKDTVRGGDDRAAKAADEILGGKKYSGLDRAAIRRICGDIMPRYPKYGDGLKAVKKELHIIHGAFLTKDCHERAASLISSYGGADIHSDKAFALRLMDLHMSTAERAAAADGMYCVAGGCILPGDALVDIGCGFGPFALPFFPVKPKSYTAYDICARTTDLLNAYFMPLGPGYFAAQLDAATKTPADVIVTGAGSADNTVVFMLKLFPLLEQQKKGCAFDMLSEMGFRAAVVSFPTKSASGRERGMEAFYSAMFERNLPDGLSICDKTVIGNEMFFTVEKR